jgi:hypothetical protein
MIILFLLVAFLPGVLNIWFKPVYALNNLLLRTVSAYIIPSQWTT